MSGEVFVSYSQPDRECAYELVSQLEASGVRCWIAPRDIAPGADWAAEIIRAIGSARIMVLVFSACSNGSPQVRREVERAVHKHVSIVPFRIEDVLPSESLEYFLSAQHWLDAFPPPREPHYRRLGEYLRSGVGGPPIIDQKRVEESGRFPVRFDSVVLQGIERALAQHIGPIARVLTKRAAVQATDVDALCADLAREMRSAQDREQFLNSCRNLGKQRS